ncbi:MAG: type II toxin-antitoxin system HicB family antitoxin [Chloroflexi bacterium]|nr:type II toxin-antitoxin system HicB family antitoxin [Chloroflexota bacterium]
MSFTNDPEIEFAVEICVEPDGSEFHAYCPALKGVHVSGETEEDAVENAKDAAIAYLHSLLKHHDPIPVGVIAPSRHSSGHGDFGEEMIPHRPECNQYVETLAVAR